METIPERLERHPAQLNFPGEAGEVRYRGEVLVGYRGLQKLGDRPSYPSGYGLAYTASEFSDLRAEVAEVTPEAALGEVVLATSFIVTNTGGRSGVTVPQLYIGYPVPSVGRPPRELRGSWHLELGLEENAHAEIQVTRRNLSFRDVRTHSWSAEPGRIRVEIGASVEDIKLGLEMDLPAPSQHLPLTEWPTVTEWRRHPAAWEKLELSLVSFGKESKFFPLDLLVCKLLLMFEDALTFD